MKQKLLRPVGHEHFIRRLSDGSVFEAVVVNGKGISSYTGNLELALKETLAIGHPLAKRILRSSKEIRDAGGVTKKMAKVYKEAVLKKTDELMQVLVLLEGGSNGRTKGK